MFDGATPSTWKFDTNWPCWSEKADFQSIVARCASAVTPSEKNSINTNRKTTTHFPMSLLWSSHVAPKPRKGGSETRFLCKIALHLKKVCYKVSLCAYCQRQSCKACTGLSFSATKGSWGRPYYVKIWPYQPSSKTPISNQYSIVAPRT